MSFFSLVQNMLRTIMDPMKKAVIYIHTLNHFKFFVGPQLVLNQYDFLFDIDDWEILDPCSTVFQAGITEH